MVAPARAAYLMRRSAHAAGRLTPFAMTTESRPLTANDISIRSFETHEEFLGGVTMQRDTWGATFIDLVPPTVMKISRRLGGVAAGAFTPDGRMVGFVFGITGVERGVLVHWSDMLAVRPEVQNLGVGRRLKEFQRREVARVGARLIYWTYDPLQARNAHLNFNVLGVRATEYVEDMYGDTDSPLHRGIGTDRFIVAWAVDDVELRARQRVVAAALADEEFRHAPVVNPELDGGILTRLAPKLRVQVPGNIGALQADDLATAVRWRASSRAAIQHLLRAGYSVNGFRRDAGADRGYYLFATS